jgi:hypothetical protein
MFIVSGGIKSGWFLKKRYFIWLLPMSGFLCHQKSQGLDNSSPCDLLFV